MKKLICLVLVGLACALTVGGCSSDDDDSDPCADACNKLNDCGLCVSADGVCLSVSECISGCNENGEQSAANCVNSVSGCNEEALAQCVAGAS